MRSHHSKITVATGKAYTARAFSPQLTEGIRFVYTILFRTNQQFSEPIKTEVLISAQTLYMSILTNGSLFVKKILLPFFSEVVKTKIFRRLILFTASDTGKDENDYCNDIRKHFEKFLIGNIKA